MNHPNIPAAMDDVLNPITTKAMKVKLSRGTGYARIRDKDAEALVKQTLGDEGQTVSKNLFKNKTCLIYKRAQVANEMYQYHVKYTLPHLDDGWRLLPNTLYMDYTLEITQYASKLEAMDAQIIAQYDSLVQTDIDERNAALTANGKAPIAAHKDYPSLDHMRRLLYVRYYFEPISTANDFRFAVTEQDKARLNELIEQVEARAKADIFDRMLEPMKRFIEKLSVPIGEEGSIFRDSLITNINEVLDIVPKLNIDGDPRITDAVIELNNMIKPYVFAPDQLRDNPYIRDLAKDKMVDLVERLEGYSF